MSDTRRQAHRLIDRLPETKLTALVGFLETIMDPEEISEGEERAIDEAKQWLRENGGQGVPHEEVLAEFDLTADDFRRMG